MRTMAIENTSLRSKIHPQKFALWLSFGSIIMMFTALLSAFMVKQAQGDWLEFAVPSLFYVSTAVLIISSITLHSAYRSFINGKEKPYKFLLIISLVLGIAFVVLQYNGWMQMFANGIDLKKNVSGSFFYLITGVHAAHILGGIAAIIVALIHAFTLRFNVTEKRKLRFSLVVHYWHFVDFLWLYLLGFLILYR